MAKLHRLAGRRASISPEAAAGLRACHDCNQAVVNVLQHALIRCLRLIQGDLALQRGFVRLVGDANRDDRHLAPRRAGALGNIPNTKCEWKALLVNTIRVTDGVHL